jgi:hypothetical protein
MNLLERYDIIFRKEYLRDGICPICDCDCLCNDREISLEHREGCPRNEGRFNDHICHICKRKWNE